MEQFANVFLNSFQNERKTILDKNRLPIRCIEYDAGQLYTHFPSISSIDTACILAIILASIKGGQKWQH